jgi:hypothetical protein
MEANMDDATFLKDLEALDKDFADRWKKLSGGKLKHVLSARDIEKLMDPLMKAGKITPKQAKCIQSLWAWCKMSKEAGPTLYAYVDIAYDLDYFFTASAKPLLTADELKEFDAALGMGRIGKVSFTSPGSGLTYAPNMFTTIQKLVGDKKIKVFSVDAAGLHSLAGHYRSDLDRLIVYENLIIDKLATIAHEVTHAIQDWLDNAKKKFHEADAFIVAGVSELSAGKSQIFYEFPAQETAAKLVHGGKATGKAWTDAYNDLVGQVSKSPTYARVKDIVWDASKAEKGKNEKADFEAKLTALATP